jgi:hypothetical protein
MVRKAWACVALALGLGGCADINDFLLGDVANQPTGEIVTGRYFRTRLSGDILEFPCHYGQICKAVLIRDNYLRFHSFDLDGKKLVLRVQRTNACHDVHSSDFACHTSPDGTALIILQWIEPDV